MRPSMSSGPAAVGSVTTAGDATGGRGEGGYRRSAASPAASAPAGRSHTARGRRGDRAAQTGQVVRALRASRDVGPGLLGLAPLQRAEGEQARALAPAAVEEAIH